MKIFKLFIDENIKTWKKFSTKLAIFLIFLALIAALGMAKITQNLDAKNNGQTVYYEGNWKEDVEAEIKSYKEQLNNSSLSEFEKKQIENEIIIDEIRIQKNINKAQAKQKPYPSIRASTAQQHQNNAVRLANRICQYRQ